MTDLKTDVIYKPKGRAEEYAKWACNLYTGCTHGCTYCYAPGAMRMKRDEFHRDVRPRKDILKRMAKDAAKLAEAGVTDEVMLCFTCDAYAAHIDTSTTRAALLILGEAGLNATVLTKGGMRAERDFDLLKKYGFRFGTSLVFLSEEDTKEWEPHAARAVDRWLAIMRAKKRRIPTWVSLEPVIDTEQTLDTIDWLHPYVDHWKVGKWNHDKRAAAIGWPRFLSDVTAKLDGYGAEYTIKKDLLKAGKGGGA